ncbi:MAG: hypothetical protein BWX55_00385 [Deltaproteobacteria bacterium ADurb.Bin022]|nr:MAG: hypothetical protein BWX55_00385 [Deltaproteobacteria bacterium ADurb.Bin022]
MNLQNIFIGLQDNFFLLLRNDHIAHGKGEPRNGRILEPQILEFIGQNDGCLVAAQTITMIYQAGQFFLVHQFVDIVEADLLGHDFGKNDSSSRGFFQFRINAHLDPRMQVNHAVINGGAHFVGTRKNHPVALDAGLGPGQVINTQNDVLAGNDDRAAVGRRKNIIGGHHQNACFRLCFNGQRNMHSHLVAVKIRVERRTNQRVKLDGLAFDQDRFKGLDAQTMQRRRAV